MYDFFRRLLYLSKSQGDGRKLDYQISRLYHTLLFQTKVQVLNSKVYLCNRHFKHCYCYAMQMLSNTKLQLRSFTVHKQKEFEMSDRNRWKHLQERKKWQNVVLRATVDYVWQLKSQVEKFLRSKQVCIVLLLSPDDEC